jgi:RecJ-like exonuclease
MYLLWTVEFLYLVALLIMFSAVILIGIGSALAKGYDRSIDVEPVYCYYCEGSGKIEGTLGPEVCPRCGGTGLARPEDKE